jgi:hypothetical protein
LPRFVHRVTALLLAGAAVLIVASNALASPKLAVYGCYSSGAFGLNYDGALQLKSRSVYLAASDNGGKPDHLIGKTSQGRYTSHGNKIRFTSGAYKGFLGLYIVNHQDKGYGKQGHIWINLYKPTYHNWTGISCELG